MNYYLIFFIFPPRKYKENTDKTRLNFVFLPDGNDTDKSDDKIWN